MVFVRTLYFSIRAFTYAPVKRDRKNGLENAVTPPSPQRVVSILDQQIEIDRLGNERVVVVDPKIAIKTNLNRFRNKRRDSLKASLKIRHSFSSSTLSSFANQLRSYIDKHGEFTVWVLSAFQICFLCFSAPRHVTPAFFESLIQVTASKKRLGPHASRIVRGMSELNGHLSSLPQRHEIEVIPLGTPSKDHISKYMKLSSQSPALANVLNPMKPILDVLSPSIHHDRLVCAIQHPGNASCMEGGLLTSKQVFAGLWKTYVVLNSVSFVFGEVRHLVGGGKKAAESDESSSRSRPSLQSRLQKVAVTTLRNTLMVSSYVGVFSYFLCLLRRHFPGREYLLNYGVAGVLAAPTIYVDKPGRLTELNAFVVSKIIESLIISLRVWRIIKYSRLFENCLMFPTYGVLSVIMQDHQHALNGFTTPLLRWFYNL